MAKTTAKSVKQGLIEVRRSKVHGNGVFARHEIGKGERLIEYLGERVSHKEADRRYETKSANDSHTFLFIVSNRTVIDAGVDGNDARYFNYSCDPNCESVIEGGRVYIDAIRAIKPGEEMTYDYQLYRDADDPDDIDEVFACRCGSSKCRGTMLWPPEKPKRKRKKSATSKGAAGRGAAGKGVAGKGAVKKSAGGKGAGKGTGQKTAGQKTGAQSSAQRAKKKAGVRSNAEARSKAAPAQKGGRRR